MLKFVFKIFLNERNNKISYQTQKFSWWLNQQFHGHGLEVFFKNGIFKNVGKFRKNSNVLNKINELI